MNTQIRVRGFLNVFDDRWKDTKGHITFGTLERDGQNIKTEMKYKICQTARICKNMSVEDVLSVRPSLGLFTLSGNSLPTLADARDEGATPP